MSERMNRSQARTQTTPIEQITLYFPCRSQNDGGAAQVCGGTEATILQPSPASRIKAQARQKPRWERKDSGEPKPSFRRGRQWKRRRNAEMRCKIGGM